MFASPSFARKRTPKAGRRGEQLGGLLHGGRAAAAGQQPAAAEAAPHPQPQPLHRHRPHPHGDGGGHLPQAGPPPVPGHKKRVRAELGVKDGRPAGVGAVARGVVCVFAGGCWASSPRRTSCDTWLR